MNRCKSFVLACFVAASLGIAGCNGSGDSSEASDGTGSVVATAAISGGSATSEGQVAYGSDPRSKASYLAKLERALSPIPSAWAVPSCDWSSVLSSCNAGSETLSFDGCSTPDDPAIRIRGSLTLAWSAPACCASNPLGAAAGCSFARRTIAANGSIDPLVRSIGANGVTLNTEEVSGYAEPKSGGFIVLCQGAGANTTCEAQRAITIAGAHYTGRASSAQWDHTVSTDQPVVEQGHGASRRILSGVVRVQHNLAGATSISTVTSPLTHSDNCCYPTGGAISTTYAGGSLDGKTETLTYGPGCGQATLGDSNQQKSGLTLHHCL